MVEANQMSSSFSWQSKGRAQHARNLLKNLLDLFMEQGERDWQRGISTAFLELTDSQGNLNLWGGGENAASIYRSMTSDDRGFSEYFIWSPDDHERIRANQKLDELRDALWKVFSTL